MDVLEFIKAGWDETVRTSKEVSGGTLLPLPFPYTVPCKDGHFQELYYWDTYFACRGLLLSGREDLVKNNLQNFIYLINTYGFIPNGSRTYYLNRSQPPFFALMVRDYYAATGDKALLEEAYQTLCLEHQFWMTRRVCENGLNCYSADATLEEYIHGKTCYEERVQTTLEGDAAYWGLQALAEAESGWDFTPRFAGRCHEHNPVDLNSLLYFLETYLSQIEPLLKKGDGSRWAALAQARKAKMLALMRGEDGLFYDYCYTQNRRSRLISCAAFYPWFVGLADAPKPLEKALAALELPFGLQATAAAAGNFQWGQHNGWACLQLMAVEALEHAGKTQDALRIAKKYTSLVEQSFAATGRLWEKYNVCTGDHNAVGEYGTPEMLGWSAGVYLACRAKLNAQM